MKIRLLAKVSTLVLLTLGIYSTSTAQLVIDGSMTPDEMTSNLVGNGVSISNTVITGAPGSYGYYYSDNTEIGTSEGILLTTGQLSNVLGPNNQTGFPTLDSLNNCLNCDDYDNNFGGSPLLNGAFGVTTWDAVRYEFDVVPQGDSLSFEFHFASEEYLEWVNSSFNDVFGFFITGPPGSGLNDVNIATIPGTTTPISVNTVNHIDNSAYFYDNTNPAGDGIQFDGFTVNTIAAIGDLDPCATYHITLLIADVSDRLWDSGVFISKLESNPVTIETSTTEGLPYMIEGCNDGFVNFVNPYPAIGDLDIEFTLGGDAGLGTDYLTVPDLGPFYDILTDSYSMTIPAGDTTVGFAIFPQIDNLEGEETIDINLTFQLCDTSSVINSSISFSILDELPMTLTSPGGTLCPGECYQLTGTAETAGTATYFWSPTTNMSDTLSLTPTVCPTETTTYTLNNVAGACSNSEQVSVVISPLEADLAVTNVTCAEDNIGAIDITMTTGLAPYTYEWIGPNLFTSNDEDITDLEQGLYCVTVEDATGCTTQFCATVSEDNTLDVTTVTSDFGCSNEISCNGLSDGFINVTVAGGVPITSTTWTLGGVFFSNDEDISGLGEGVYELTVIDDDGCTDVTTVNIDQPDPISIVVTGVSEVLCNGDSSGEIIVDASGGCAPYFYSWAHDATLTSPIINVPTGTYVATASDINGCLSVDSASVVVNEPAAPISVSNITAFLHPNGFNVTCPEAADGSVTIDVAGGTPGVFPDPLYTYSWEHIGTGLILTDEDPIGMICGDWELIVTDDNDCSFTEIVTVTCVPDITIDFTTVPNACEDPNGGAGEIHIDSFGGGNGGPYTIISWVGPSCPCAGMDLTGLNSGTYTVTVQDADLCTETFDISIGEDAAIGVIPDITDETCFGYGDGAIEIDVDTPYDSIAWIGPNDFTSNLEDISGLIGGNYSVTVYAGNCENTFVFNVGSAPEITMDFDVTPPTCFGNNNGEITVTLGGGVGILTPTWSADSCFFFPPDPNATTINNLLDCTYNIVVEDDNGCIATDSIVLEAPQVMDLDVSVSLYNGGFNVSCNDANDGSISVVPTGGTPDCVTFAPECYDYEWTGPGVLVPGSFQNNLIGGVYSVIVTDSSGCVAQTVIDMLEPDPITINANVAPMSCNDEVAPWVEIEIVGGSGVYGVPNWIDDISPNEPGDTLLLNLLLGEYCAEIMDSNSCIDTACFEVVAPEQITITVDSIQNVTCFGEDDGYISVSASGGIEPYTYTWTGDTATTGLIQDLIAGSYTVEVVDTFGCSNMETFNITEPDLLTLDLLVPSVLVDPPFTIPCTGDEVVIISDGNGGTGDYSYLWVDCDDNFIDSLSSTISEGVGCYQLTITDENGCVAQDTITLTEPDTLLQVTVNPFVFSNGFNLSCFNSADGSICADVIGGVPDYNYVWTSGTDTLSFDVCIDSLEAETFELVVIDSNGCTMFETVSLTAPPVISLNDSDENVSCYGECDGSITINPTGGTGVLDVDWDVVVTDSLNLENLCADSYMVLVTDEMGCEIENTFTITQPDSLWLDTPSINNITCFGDDNGSIFSDPNGGTGDYDYTWVPNEGSTQGITDLEAGQYCLTVMDENDCEATACYDVTEPTIINADFTTIDATCGLPNGMISDSTITGGIAPYTINWNGQDPDALVPGDYTATITDAVDCTFDVDYSIGGPDPIEIESIITDLTCYNSQEGGIDVTLISNDITVDEYEWLNDDDVVIGNAIDIDNLNGGFYTLVIHWNGDCEVPFTFFIEEPLEIIVNGNVLPEEVYGFNIAVNGDNTGEIETNVVGGMPGYSYDWTGGAMEIPSGTTNPMDLIAGSYPLQVIDLNGCVVDTVFTITEAPDLALPTGLTPNNDGDNDFFVILGIAKYSNNTFQVFNRWGNLVYDKSNYDNTWNGQNNDGEDLPNGTYYVIFESGTKEVNTFVDLRK